VVNMVSVIANSAFTTSTESDCAYTVNEKNNNMYVRVLRKVI
jgi:hypothetical protein